MSVLVYNYLSLQELANSFVMSVKSDSGSVTGALNRTGIQELTTTRLTEIFDADAGKFFKFIETKYNRYTTKIAFYDASTVNDVDAADCMMDEVLQIVASANCIRRFADNAAGLAEDAQNDKLIEMESKWDEMSFKYMKLYNEFKSKLIALKTDTVALKPRTLEDRTVGRAGSVAEDMSKEKGYAKLLPMSYDVTSFNQTEFTAVNGSSDQELDHELEPNEAARDNERSKGVPVDESTAPAMNAASTPLARKHTRFSEVVNHHTISAVNTSSIENPSCVVDGIYQPGGSARSAPGSRSSNTTDNQNNVNTRVRGSEFEGIGVSGARTSESRRNENFGERLPVDRSNTERRHARTDDSWRYCEPVSCLIEELSLCEDLHSISQIVEQRVSEDIGDVELLALESRDVLELKSLKRDLEKKSSALPAECNQHLKSEAMKGFNAASLWIERVKSLIKVRQLHLTSDLKYSKPMELQPFKGYANAETNCYEFFCSYEQIARKYTDRDKASYLYANYLSENIQCEVKHLNTSYAAMKNSIIARHGNVNILMMHKKNKIRTLKMIYYKSPRSEKLTYIKSYMEILDQLCSLIELNTKEYPSMRHELLSYVSVMDLVKLLPEYIFNVFNSNYTKEVTRREIQALTGEESFKLLQRILKQFLGELELHEELFFETEEKAQKDGKSSRGFKKGVMYCEQDEDDCEYSQYSSKEKRPFSSEEYWGAPCIAHAETKYKLKDCLAGRCNEFLEMQPKDRERAAKEKNVCHLCLLFGCRLRGEGKCLFVKALPKNVVCKGCQAEGVEKNVLLCGKHKNNTPEIQSAVREFLPGCSENTTAELFFLQGQVFKFEAEENEKETCFRTCADAFDINTGKRVPMSEVQYKTQKDHGSLAVYPTQTINIGGIPVTILWDTGAIGELVKEDIAEKLNLTILDARSQSFSVAGGDVVTTNCPLYQLTIGPNDRDMYHQFPMLGVKRISESLKDVDLAPVVERIKRELVDFPESKEKFPQRCGGSEIEMILGTRLSHLFPTRIFVLKDGLQIWRSPLRDVYGSNLLVSGPIEPIRNSVGLVSILHTAYQGMLPDMLDVLSPIDSIVLKETEEDLHDDGESLLFLSERSQDENATEQIFEDDSPFESLFLSERSQDENEVDRSVLLEADNAVRVLNCILKKRAIPKTLEQTYRDEEEAGSVVDYRCSDCYPCKACLQSARIRNRSIKEVAEEALIWKCVKVDAEKGLTTCDYPFTVDPEVYLKKKWGGDSNNYKMAKRTLDTQRAKPEESRRNVVKFNRELYEKGFVSPLSELSTELQELISSATFRHYFCWRSVSNQNSLTTSTRMVTDPTISHFNDVVAKGVNSLTSLYQLILCWRSYLFAFCSDISKMFNTLRMTPEMLRFSLYLFSETLDPLEEIQEWVYVSLMYGIKSSSNLATCGLRKTADLKKDELPLAHDVIYSKTYMDDSGGGANTPEKLNRIINELLEVLPLGGFAIKIVTKSGEPPGEKASSDGVTSSFGGYSWKTVADSMMYKSSDLNFNIKRRGFKKPNEKPLVTQSDVRELIGTINLTRRNLLGKVLEQFDLVGLFEPLKVRYKMSLHLLAGKDYDEAVEGALREEWTENLMLMHMSRDLECPRSVIPMDASNPDDLELICCSDAATSMCGAALYLRVKLKSGGYSVKLLTARSKTTRLSIPRNELLGCMLASETAFIAVKALEGRVKKVIFVTDSAIALCWLNNIDLKLKQFVYARVQHCRRLIGDHSFYHIPGALNPADLVTRGSCQLEDVEPGSIWQEGADWMRLEVSEMPIRSYSQVCADLTPQDVDTVEKEIHPTIPGVNLVRHPVLDELESCFCVQAFDSDILNTAKTVCTGSCQKPDHIVSSMEAVCPAVNIVRSETSEGKDVSIFSSKVVESKVEYPVDFIKFGFRKSFLILAYVQRFLTKLRHSVHQKKGVEDCSKCPLCRVKRLVSERQFTKLSEKFKPVHTGATCTSLDFHLAWKVLCRLGTQEVKEHYKSTPSKLSRYHEKDQILYGAGCLEYPDMRIEIETPVHSVDFVKPVFLNSSVITFSLALHIHWDPSFCPHSGVSRTGTFLARIIHVSNVAKIIKFIRESCCRCRYLLKKHYLPLGTNQSVFSLMRAPPFFAMMVDIVMGYVAHDSVRLRVTKDCYFLVQVCLTTGATSIGVMEDLSTSSVVLALTRTGNRYGLPKYALFDCQSSFKSLENAKFSFKDLQGKLWVDQEMVLDFSTPHAHQEHGRVEAKVKVLKEFLMKSGELGRRHSFIQWETIVSSVSSFINGLPVCSNSDDHGGTYGDLNLITPNLLLIGRNNARSPEGFVSFTTNPGKALKNIAETNQLIYDLLGQFIARFIPGKRFTNSRPPEVNDIVLCLMKEAQRTRNCVYKFGRIIEVFLDGRPNKVLIEYQNSTECTKRRVERNVQNLVLILSVNEISLNSYELHQAAYAQRKFL